MYMYLFDDANSNFNGGTGSFASCISGDPNHDICFIIMPGSVLGLCYLGL